MKRMAALLFVSVFFMFCNSVVIADDSVDEGVSEVSIVAELFRWQEFDRTGTRLLTEQGVRNRLSFSHNNEMRSSSGVLYRVSGSVYGGAVDYDGQTQPVDLTTPKIETHHYAAASVDYRGGVGELAGGYRIVDFKWGRALDLLVGMGVDSWSRDIGDGTSSQGGTVFGYEEDYEIVFSRFSLGMEKKTAIWRSLWRAGILYPISTNEKIEGLPFKLKPGREPSAFFSYRFQLADSDDGDAALYAKFVYDSYRFSKSAVVSGFEQPKSSMDVVSLSIGRAF